MFDNFSAQGPVKEAQGSNTSCQKMVAHFFKHPVFCRRLDFNPI